MTSKFMPKQIHVPQTINSPFRFGLLPGFWKGSVLTLVAGEPVVVFYCCFDFQLLLLNFIIFGVEQSDS